MRAKLEGIGIRMQELARKKLFPALYQLVLLGHFPRGLNIVGYGRSQVVLDEFLEKQCVNIKEQPGLPKAELVNGVQHAESLEVPLPEVLEAWQCLHRGDFLASAVVDVALPLRL